MKRYIVLLTALVISHFAMAQDFKPMEHNGLLYQELVFCNDVKGKIPLVIYLHGRHASGNDNQKQLSQAGVQEIDKYLRKNAIPAYFLVPQCPEDYEWDGRNGNSGYTDKVVDLITFYLKTKDIDMNALKWLTTEIRKAGGNVKFDVLFGQKHRNACDNAFSTKRIKWLFSQVRD